MVTAKSMTGAGVAVVAAMKGKEMPLLQASEESMNSRGTRVFAGFMIDYGG